MGYRVLLADDETQFDDVVKTDLELKGYKVTQVFDQEQLLDAVEMDRPDVVVLDALMDKSFYTVEQLRADPETSDIRVIMVSTRDDGDFIRQAWEHEIDLLVTKPVAPPELSAIVSRVLADKEEEPYRELAHVHQELGGASYS